MTYPALADASSLKRELVEGLDIMILRELTGGVYFGEPKTITDLGNGQKRAIDTQVYDTYEIERIAPRRLRAGAQAPQQGHVDGKAQRHEDRRALERGGDAGARSASSRTCSSSISSPMPAACSSCAIPSSST